MSIHTSISFLTAERGLQLFMKIVVKFTPNFDRQFYINICHKFIGLLHGLASSINFVFIKQQTKGGNIK